MTTRYGNPEGRFCGNCSFFESFGDTNRIDDLRAQIKDLEAEL